MILQELQSPKVTVGNRFDIHSLSDGSSSDVAEVAEIIKANCSEMLAAYRQSGKVLFRGLKGGGGDIIISGIRQQRKPVQMNLDKHKVLIKFFLSKGLKVTRGNSIFTTAKQTVAADWGNTYAIFVKDGWTAQVYDKCQDTYSFYTLRDVGETLLTLAYRKKIPKDMSFSELQRKWAEDDIKSLPAKIDKMFDSLSPREFSDSASLATVLRKQYHEALVTGDSYIGVRRRSPMFDELLKALGITS